MNIKNFEKYIDNVIVGRGRHYWNQGYVTSLEYDADDDEWVAEVEGTGDYTVTAELTENGDITDSECDCPYDYGDYCKHQVAVFYAIRQTWEDIGLAQPNENTGKLKFEDALPKLEKEELIAFLLDYGRDNKRFKNEFMLYFTDKFIDKSDVLSYARHLVKAPFTVIPKRGEIAYRDAPKAVEGAEKVLEMAEKSVENDDIHTAINLCLIVFEEMSTASGNYDDHDGYFHGNAERAAAIMDETLEVITEDCQELKDAFNLITASLSKNRIHSGFISLQLRIMKMFSRLCHIKYIRKGVDNHLTNLSFRESSYYRDEIQKLQYELILEFDGGEKSLDFINSNLDNDKFRELAIQHAIESKDYIKAAELCSGGEKSDERIVNKWKKLRYEVYAKSGDISSQKKLAREFIRAGEFEYYLKLRQLYAESPEDTGEWHQVFDEILAELSERPVYRFHNANTIYAQILIHENMKPELLEYCRNYKRAVTELHKHLLPDYKDEVNEIFADYLREQVVDTSDRSRYREICKLIQQYAKVCGNRNAADIIDEFEKLYVKRRAFIDELSKIRIR